MDEITKNQIPKLKLLKLNSLLISENQTQRNFMKTERLFPKFSHKFTLLRYPTQLIKSPNNFSKTNSIKLKENYKKKISKRYSHLNFALPFVSNETKKQKNFYGKNNIYTLNSNEGFNNYLKEKTNKLYMKMNRMLMEENLNRLSMPKFKRAKRGETIKREKSKYLEDYEDQIEVDWDDKERKLKIEKKHKNKMRKSLFEKEKIRCREKFKFMLKNNFKELDNCEKKFDKIIEKTFKLLSEYKKSLTYLKNTDYNE